MFATMFTQGIGILFCALSLASCTAPARTVRELRTAPSGISKQAYTINREFSRVVSDVKRKSAECLEFGYTNTTQNGIHYSQTTFVYHPKQDYQ